MAQSWHENWFIAWADLADGIAGVVTLGYLRLDLGSKVRIWSLRRQLKEK